MLYDISKLIQEGLIKKIPPSKYEAEQSIKSALLWIEESNKNIKANSYKSSLLTSYLAIFHSARSILFFDGFREKSHFAVARYLEDKYANKGLLEKEWISLFDYYRELRHENQYRTSFIITEKEAKKAFNSAEKFLERMNKLLKSLKSNLNY